MNFIADQNIHILKKSFCSLPFPFSPNLWTASNTVPYLDINIAVKTIEVLQEPRLSFEIPIQQKKKKKQYWKIINNLYTFWSDVSENLNKTNFCSFFFKK